MLVPSGCDFALVGRLYQQLRSINWTALNAFLLIINFTSEPAVDSISRFPFKLLGKKKAESSWFELAELPLRNSGSSRHRKTQYSDCRPFRDKED